MNEEGVRLYVSPNTTMEQTTTSTQKEQQPTDTAMIVTPLQEGGRARVDDSTGLLEGPTFPNLAGGTPTEPGNTSTQPVVVAWTGAALPTCVVTTSSSHDHETNISTPFTVGDRIDVYWSSCGRYFSGTVTNVKAVGDQCFVTYDDGDSEWIDWKTAVVRPTLLGCKVDILWKEEDGVYHTGTVTKVHKNEDWHFVEYDDGENIAWLDFKESVYRVVEQAPAPKDSKKKKKQKASPPKEETLKSAKQKESDSPKEDASAIATPERMNKRKASDDEDVTTTPARRTTCRKKEEGLPVGTLLGIWWDDDQQYYNGIIQKKKGSKDYILYDDGEEEWVDLSKEVYKVLGENENSNIPPSPSSSEVLIECRDLRSIRIGTRVAVWWKEHARYYAATVQQLGMICNTEQTPLFDLQYDDAPRRHEWRSLESERFRLLVSPGDA